MAVNNLNLKMNDIGKVLDTVLADGTAARGTHGRAYSDTGDILAGLIIEAVTERPCFDQIQERFLLPLVKTLDPDGRLH